MGTSEQYLMCRSIFVKFRVREEAHHHNTIESANSILWFDAKKYINTVCFGSTLSQMHAFALLSAKKYLACKTFIPIELHTYCVVVFLADIFCILKQEEDRN